jgi:hypothetical protein
VIQVPLLFFSNSPSIQLCQSCLILPDQSVHCADLSILITDLGADASLFHRRDSGTFMDCLDILLALIGIAAMIDKAVPPYPN